MILEAVLYFVLGFLSAGLLALMISPAIWNRAVVLTKRKVESSIPLTLNEIQADKDQLRAEFSMSTRRLEMSVDELRKKASSQIAEISRKRDEIAKYDSEKAERISELRQLEAKSTELGRRLEEREMQLKETSSRMKTTQEQYVQTLEELSTARSSLAEKDDELTSQRIELAAHETRISTLSDENRRSNITGSEDAAEYLDEIASLKAELKREQLKAKEAEKASKVAQEEALKAAEKTRTKDAELNETRFAGTQSNGEIGKLNDQLLREREKTVDLEARLATQAIKMETLLSNASGENIDQAVAAVEGQVSDMQKNLIKVKNERDELQETLKNISSDAKENWSDERKENALLRERMNDMSARIAVMAAEIEGADAGVNKLLAKEVKAAKRKTTTKPITDIDSDDDGHVSLAERIRAIQAASNSRN